MPTPIKVPAKVASIIQHTEDVKSFVMLPLSRCPTFKPGQFLHLAIDQYDPSFQWPESRVFSIASSPGQFTEITITFSVKGKFTRRMFDEVKNGDLVWLKFPYGSFLFIDDKADIILIAGGTGITPFVSFLKHSIKNKLDTNISLYYGVRSPEYLIFDSLLQECQKKLKNYKHHIFFEADSEKNEFDVVSNGRLSIETILIDTVGNDNAIYYLSGPQKMILNFKKQLLKSGLSENKIIIDEWE